MSTNPTSKPPFSIQSFTFFHIRSYPSNDAVLSAPSFARDFYAPVRLSRHVADTCAMLVRKKYQIWESGIGRSSDLLRI